MLSLWDSGFLWVFLAVAVLGGGLFWVCFGFFAVLMFSLSSVSSFRLFLVYFLCTRVAPLCTFDI